MPEFDCNDAGLKRRLREMHDIVLDAGGTVHNELVFLERAGQLSIRAPFVTAPNEPILTVPGEALIPVDHFQLGLQGNEIGIVSVSSELTDLRKSLLRLFIDIYNRTDKIASHKAVNTLLLKMEDTNFFEKLYEARQQKGDYEKFFKGINMNDYNELVIKSFLRTRQLGCRIHKGKGAENMLAPLLDFVNNHPKSPIFNSGFVPKDGYTSSIIRSCPTPGSNECYVSYGMKDAHDILLSYNYVEPNVYFTRSVPITIEIPGTVKSLDVLSNSMQPISKHKLPERFKDLYAYFPPFRFKPDNKDVLEVAYLPIPKEMAPHALRRILKFLVHKIAPELYQEQIREIVLQSEETILRKNVNYYRELCYFFANYDPIHAQSPILPMARQMTALQLRNLQKYPLANLVA